MRKSMLRKVLALTLLFCCTFSTAGAALQDPSGDETAKTSDMIRTVGWQKDYLEDLLEIINKSYGPSSVGINNGISGGSGGGGDMVEVATGEIGQTESGNNNCKYTQWYGMVGAPWCAMFISWCADQCGYLDSGLIPRTAHSATFWNYVLNDPSKGSLYTPADVRSGAVTPQAGDILIISPTNNQEAPNNTTRADDGGSGTRHVALVTGYDASSGKIATIDGNSSDSVKENTYNIAPGSMSRNILGFVRPAYPAPANSVEISGGIPHTVQGLDMDTDGGSKPEDKADHYYQSQTSLSTADGAYFDASYDHFIVVARGSTYLLGCLVTIKDVSSGKVINCVAADSGPRPNDWNEVSIQTARDLGYSVSCNNGVDTSKQFVITYFPDCKLTLYRNGHGTINEQIDKQAAEYAASKGGNVSGGGSAGGHTPNFGADDAGGGKID